MKKDIPALPVQDHPPIRARKAAGGKPACNGVLVYDASQAEPLRRFEWKGSTLAIEWSPDGHYIATGNQDSTVHFWITGTGRDLITGLLRRLARDVGLSVLLLIAAGLVVLMVAGIIPDAVVCERLPDVVLCLN